MTDRELLELAAKAAGLDYIKPAEGYDGSLGLEIGSNPMRTQSWNPLTDDGDALRLAVVLRLDLHIYPDHAYAHAGVLRNKRIAANGNIYAATRRAIVRAAAEIGKEMK